MTDEATQPLSSTNGSTMAGVELQLRSKKSLICIAASTMLCLFCLIFSVVFFGGEIRQKVAFEALVHSVTYGSSTQNLAALADYRAAPSPFFWLKSTLDRDFERTQAAKGAALENLLLVNSNISLNDYVAAAVLLRDRVIPEVQNILISLDLTPEDRALVHLIIERSTTWTGEVFALSKIESTRGELVAEHTEKLQQLNILAQESIYEITTFFNLPSETEEDGGVLFYESGTLAGLPKLRGIPDGVESLTALKEALEIAGGSVAVKGKNAKSIFLRKLEQFKSDMETFRTPIEASKQEISHTEKEFHRLKKSVYDRAKEVQPDIVALISKVAKPELAPVSSFLSFLFTDQ